MIRYDIRFDTDETVIIELVTGSSVARADFTLDYVAVLSLAVAALLPFTFQVPPISIRWLPIPYHGI